MKGKKTIFVGLAVLLSLSIPTAFSKSDTFSVDYVFEPVTMGDQCCQWMVEDTQVLSIAGEPLVPYKAARILLPQGATLKDVKVKHGNPVVQKGFEIPWGQPPCTFSDTPVKVGKNEAVYNSDGWYLGKTFDIVSVESFKGFDILLVHLYPVDYQLKSGTVKFYPKMTVEVQFGKGLKNKLYRGLDADKAAVADMVDNVEVVSTYEEGGTPLATEEYIIITSSTLKSTFQTLATHKGGYVNGATVYDTTWIYANYTGTDNQMKIRNFIIDKYNNNGLKYVLLGGDTGVVPYRGFYVSTGGYTDSDMAADMYYGHLDGSHNSDGDSRYGETNDNVDFYADVAVGRAPVDNTTEAAAFVNKVIAYEGMYKPKRVCFHQSRVQSGNSPDSTCLACNCDNWIPGDYCKDYVFEETGTVSKTVWRNAWSAGPIVVAHIGHGNTTVYYINYEIGGTVSWYTSDVSSLTNTFYPWTTSVACICGEFEASDCLAEQYVKDDCGAIGAIYNDNYGWFSTGNACMYSGEFCEMEVRACWSDGYEKLGELRDRSRHYMASSASSNTTYRWCFYERNLMGDPETPCLTKRGGGSPPSPPPQPPPKVTITNPTDGSYVHNDETVNITATVTGCTDIVKFYLIYINSNDEVVGELLDTDDCPPFKCTWDPDEYTTGKWYTIRADGYWNSQVRDVDEITVWLRPSCTQYLSHIVIYAYGEGLGTMLLAFLLLCGFTGIITRKRIQKSMHRIRKAKLPNSGKAITLILVLALSLNMPAALSSKDSFSVEYQFTPAPLEGCDSWMVEDTQTREIPGEPLIPYKAAQILLPQGTVVKDIKVKTSNPIVQTGIDIPWGQPPCTFSDGPEMVGKNEKIYNADKVYPDTLYEVVGVGSFRGFQILNIHLFPVQYKPKSQTVYFYEMLTVQVKTGKGSKNTLYRGLPSDKQDVSSVVDNPEMVTTYEDGPMPLATEEYIIITNDTLQCIFQDLADWKSCYVNGTGVYTVSWIYANYTGVDKPEKIRNFIKDKYTNNGTKYVLLGGDVEEGDPDNSVVPYRGFYISCGGYTDYDMLADMYFAHLDGTFNSDSDSRWAEPNDGVDWYAEVAVGRAPVETTTEAQNFVDKVIAYEKAEKPKRVLLHQSRVMTGNVPDSRCLAYNCDDWVPGDYTIDYLFEENGTVTKTKWRDAWAANPVAVAHMGDGDYLNHNYDHYYINYEVGGTITWYCSDVASLTNTFWPWTTSVSCFTGEIEIDDCLAECYVKDPDNGAIAAIYNDNYGWCSYSDACMYSGEFCEMEFKACFTDGKEKLGDMLNQARSYLVSSAQSNSAYRWCFYERNLIGDPESPCLTRRVSIVTITNPEDGEDVYNNESIDITTDIEGHMSKVKFYLVYINNNTVTGELLCEDTTSPFECTWDPTGYTTGKWYTIRADGYWCGQIKDVDEITIRLCSSSPTVYPTRIVNYGHGEGLGTILLALFVVFGSLGILKRQK